MSAPSPGSARFLLPSRASKPSERPRGRFGFPGISSRTFIALALFAVLATGERVQAQGACQLEFEKWTKASAAHLQTSTSGSPCVQSEAVRKALLDGLARSRAACEGDAYAQAPSPQQTKDVIDANSSFVRSIAICPKQEPAAAGGSWATHAQASPPAAAAPPAPKPAAVAVPRVAAVAPPKPAAVAAPKAAALAAPMAVAVAPATTAPPPRGCLELEHDDTERYSLANRHCPGQTVIAVVETRDAAGKTACKAYTVRNAVGVGDGKMIAAMKVNHECVLNRGACTSRHVSDMFPECDW